MARFSSRGPQSITGPQQYIKWKEMARLCSRGLICSYVLRQNARKWPENKKI